jgi:hypothetical protein
MMAMTDQEKKPVRGQGKEDVRFRAVVKRLLDTPPMHKRSKPAPSKADARSRRAKRGKDE